MIPVASPEPVAGSIPGGSTSVDASDVGGITRTVPMSIPREFPSVDAEDDASVTVLAVATSQLICSDPVISVGEGLRDVNREHPATSELVTDLRRDS